MRRKWDFFIAHAGGDTKIAENLYSILEARSKVFLDSKELTLGDTWDEDLIEAQRQSLITIVMISLNTEKAYYQREEIVVAIQMVRNRNQKHRVIPVFLPGYDKEQAPYGLNRIHSITLNNMSDLDMAGHRLLETLEKFRRKRRNIEKGVDPGLPSSLNEILQILNSIQETLNAQLLLFGRARITPQDCDECIRILLRTKETSVQFLIKSPSKHVTNQIVSLYNFDEEMLNLINLVHRFRNISLHMSSEDTRQEIIASVHNLIKDINLLILKIKG